MSETTQTEKSSENIWSKNWDDKWHEIVDVYFNKKDPVNITCCPNEDDSRLYIYIKESMIEVEEWDDNMGIREIELNQKAEWNETLKNYCRKHLIPPPHNFKWILICGGY